jgi:hypothetical protein
MEATDFRIGNKVNLFIENQTQEIEIEKIEKNYINNFSITSIKPIKITEKWLLKLGFTIENRLNGDIEYSYKDYRYILLKKEKYDGYLFCDNNIVLRDLEFIHELQNIYFALIQIEIKLKND